MLRYLSGVWDADNPTATIAALAARNRLQRSSSSWHVIFDQPGIFVAYVRDRLITEEVIALDDERGLILGTIFEAPLNQIAHARPVGKLTRQTAVRIVESGGRSLVDSHWGSYILFLRDPQSATAYVLRGPMSSLACFRSSFDSVFFFFSEVEDYARLALNRLSINWDCIRAQAVMGDYLSEETALNEILTLVSGDCIVLRRGTISRRVYWTPTDLPARPDVDDLDGAARLLKGATRYCVNAWASRHDTILVSLSGGLDSSIVLSCTGPKNFGRRIIGVNYHSRHSGDERRYARSMAEKTGVELIEVERTPDADLSTFLRCARTANPVLSFTAFIAHPFLSKLARKTGATAVFDGELGDDVFGHSFGPEIVSDALWRRAVGRLPLRTALDYAKLERISIWKALSEGLNAYSRSRRSHWSVYDYMQQRDITSERRLASREAIATYQEMHDRFIHPWLVPASDTPPGRFQLIVGLTISTSTWSHSAFADFHESSLFHSPLASQPLVEAFVQIPSYLHVTGGQSAAVARHAFKSELSTLVLERGGGTGTPDLWISDIVVRNRQFLKETLLDGMLVNRGILDASKLKAVLSGEINNSRVYAADLLVQLYIESWLRRWDSALNRAVA